MPDIETAIAEAVAEWKSATLRDSPVARSVDAWNHLESVLPDLEARLVAALTPKE